uniref:Uncharacterized protein n=1 Tax=Amphimedon queenslandica TaxID=400682 RepID=A0A1X7VKI3_AMPQE
MVQQRQWNPEQHYAAACYRYMKEYSITLRDVCAFVSLDDKYKVKVGEPNYPVAAAEQGKRVIVRSDEVLSVGDHDFTKFSLVPSVVFILNIPEQISDSWYSGSVYVGVKDLIFEPSSPFRHHTELFSVLKQVSLDKPVLFVYSDGGPDHRVTYLYVQLSLIALFLNLDLEYLCVGRTAPYHSWCNSVERIMSIINLGLQCVELARFKMSDEFEKEVSKCSSLTDLRRRLFQRKEDVKQSLSPLKSTLHSIFTRLILHDEAFQVYESASEKEISEFWICLIALDSTIEKGSIFRKETINQHPSICDFLRHCCQGSHYIFDILKCGNLECTICKPPRLPQATFNNLKHIPHPTPMDDDHYYPFSVAFNMVTTEEHCPTFKSPKQIKKKRKLHFYATRQHVKNSNLMVQCSECNMWRLVFSRYKMSSADRMNLQLILN